MRLRYWLLTLVFFTFTVGAYGAGIDVSALATGGAGTSGSPWTGWETALNAKPANVLISFPAGYYTQASAIVVKQGWTVRGEGKTASRITSSFTGDAIQSTWPINSSTAANVTIEDLGLFNTNGSNTGGGIVDVGGTYLHIQRVLVSGFKYGLILDQSELADVALCNFDSQLKAGIWLVNGNDHTSGAAGGFTNRISVKSCQFNNAGSNTVGIIDDGGYLHGFTDNNFNGFTNHMYVAGGNSVVITRNEFEAASGTNILSTYLTYHTSGAVGQNLGLTISDNTIVPTSGNNAVAFTNGTPVQLLNNVVSSTATAYVGISNINTLVALGNLQTNTGALFDSTATHHLQFSPEAVSNLRTTGLSVGGGAVITKHLSNTGTWDPPSMASGTSATTTLTVTGAQVGDTTALGLTTATSGGMILTASVTAANTVTVTLVNATASTVDLASGTLRVDVWRH